MHYMGIYFDPNHSPSQLAQITHTQNFSSIYLINVRILIIYIRIIFNVFKNFLFMYGGLNNSLVNMSLCVLYYFTRLCD